MCFVADAPPPRLLINPGSATGAPSPLRPVPARPSFVLMDVDGSRLVAYVYQLIEGEARFSCSNLLLFLYFFFARFAHDVDDAPAGEGGQDRVLQGAVTMMQ